MGLFNSRPELPPSSKRWDELDVIVGSEELSQGVVLGEIRSLGRWLDEYSRWCAGFSAFVKEAGPVEALSFVDECDKRQHEHYAALLLQSGQWLAIHLKLLGISETERAQHLDALDAQLGTLRTHIARAAR